jgi:hypothetical protein
MKPGKFPVTLVQETYKLVSSSIMKLAVKKPQAEGRGRRGES